MILDDNTFIALIESNSSRPFNVSTGVRQGDELSAALLSIAVRFIFEETV
jgi:hypothetical protein